MIYVTNVLSMNYTLNLIMMFLGVRYHRPVYSVGLPVFIHVIGSIFMSLKACDIYWNHSAG